MRVVDILKSNSDEKYKSFTAALIPDLSHDLIIGVRTPFLKGLAKELVKEGRGEEFISDLPHKYLEENNLHAFILNLEKDFDKCIDNINVFLPFVDNWATCDGLRPVCFTKNKSELLKHIFFWLESTHPYTVRFGIEMLMCHYLDDDFSTEYLEYVAQIKSDEYYVNMMIAWYFATALAKQWEDTLPYIVENRLSLWVKNKTIQKAGESYRIPVERKSLLKKYRGKGKYL